MKHNDDAFTAMLLTLSLTADKEELARPLSSAEFSELVARVANTPVKRIGGLIGMDISGMMRTLDAPEADAYRLCMLLSRTMPLSYAMERYYEQSMEILTLLDASYPERLASRLLSDAPPAMYACGDLELLKTPMVGILGIAGVKLGDDVKARVEKLVALAADAGYGIVTSSELGACRYAEAEAVKRGVKTVCVLAGDMMRRKEEDMYAEAIARREMLLLSIVHPDAPYTAVHALQRNRAVYALSVASFIATTDARRGETEALRRHFCDWLYALDTPYPAGNRVVIGRGATAVYDMNAETFQKYAHAWKMACAEQLSFL